MTVKNKNLGRPQTTKNDSLSVHFGCLSIYACVLFFVSFACNITWGQFDSDEIDLAALLTVDPEPQEPELSDIQITSHAELLALLREPITNHPIASSLQPPGTITANFLSEVNDTLPRNIPSPVDTSSAKLEHKLMESRISSLPQDNDANKTDELKKMIELVRSVKIEPHKPAQQPVPAVAPPTATAAEQPSQLVQTQRTETSTSDETLKLVENQLKDPNLINNPFELAEILFKSGKQVQAGICYKQALKILPADDPNLATERAWILFQIGNCFKDEDPNTARESYAELIRTHSNSPWAEIAKARYSIIELYQQENPGQLIRQLNRPNQ
jgi:tetratricopeptide (TPR) repeat protein